MERLYAEALLLKHGFTPPERYETQLNDRFLQTPDVGFLLELEELSGSAEDTCARFARYWTWERDDFDAVSFGKQLFYGLACAYHTERLSLEEFTRHCYALWRELPEQISKCVPFHVLSYADEPLAYGDEAQTKALLADAFAYDWDVFSFSAEDNDALYFLTHEAERGDAHQSRKKQIALAVFGAALLLAACLLFFRRQKDAPHRITVDAAYAAICETAQKARPGETVRVRLPTVTEQYYLLFVNGEAQKMDRGRSDGADTYFTFTMPDGDAYLEIREVSADIPEG